MNTNPIHLATKQAIEHARSRNHEHNRTVVRFTNHVSEGKVKVAYDFDHNGSTQARDLVVNHRFLIGDDDQLFRLTDNRLAR